MRKRGRTAKRLRVSPLCARTFTPRFLPSKKRKKSFSHLFTACGREVGQRSASG
ncbi:hypothetical protein MuYL_3057 [Mucilaginibacter xinganensis]|uniref:Uncharacterized protein n=1 Tax=Mucilaginibacter xinganensis TaxID=1234841 RepID=A0A223NYK9_9SPHI|nr:hypothetical protein MuYL_3057 [Mucilaginibacter xinganensis]